MKTTKRFLSIMIIAMMTLCLSAFNVSAAGEKNKITVTGAIENEVFKAYKLFTVESSGTGDSAAYNYIKANGFTDEQLDYSTIEDYDASEMQAFANNLYKNVIKANGISAAGEATANSNGEAIFNTLDDGYYLIVNDSLEKGNPNESDTTITFALCETNNEDVTINVKREGPTLTKEIYHNEEKSWGDVGDNQIGDQVQFKLTSRMPATYTWEGYQFIIHDELSAGLDVPSEVDVAIGNFTTKVTPVSEGGKKFEIDLSSYVDSHKGEEVVVTYSAKLNTSAKIASAAPDTNECETNIAYLEYSNDPYSTETTTTKEVKVYDWTFTVNIEKIDNDSEAKLDDAEFELLDKDNQPVNVTLSGTTYKVNPDATSNKIVVGLNGVSIQGLDDSYSYKLVETKAPEGYKLPDGDDAITIFNITANYQDTPNSLSELKATITSSNGAKANGINITIPNTTGKKLVGTGGIGTTIFYIVGGALMAGAVVLLIVRKRINNK